MSDKSPIEVIQEEVRKFNLLMQDPHPEVSTWKEVLYEQGKKVYELLEKFEFSPERRSFEGKGGTTFDVETVYQATVGHHHYGFWTSREDAEICIKANEPDAKPYVGVPTNPGSLPDGQYFIQPRCVFSYAKHT